MVKTISPYVVHVDLSFLTNIEQRNKVKKIIEQTIQALSPIPGEVKMVNLKRRGHIQVGISSSLEADTSSSNVSEHNNSPRGKSLTDSMESFLGQIKEGILLKSKIPGIKDKLISLDSLKIQESNIRKLLINQQNTDKDTLLKFYWKKQATTNFSKTLIA